MITVAGYSPSLDVTYLVDSLTLGQIHRPDEVVRCAGGKALNMARAAATLGADVCLVGILGGHTGQTVAEGLAAEGVAVRTVATPDETRTCVSVAAGDAPGLTEIYEHAAPVSAAVWTAFGDALVEAVTTRPGWLSMSGSAPRGLPSEAIADLARRARDLGARTAIDTHSAALPAALDTGPDLVKVNRAEAAEVLARPAADDLVTMGRELAARTGGMVVLTDGRDGSIAVHSGSAVRVHAPDLVGRYPVGSGDSYLGGLVHLLDSGSDLPEALRTATACGIANALVPGAGRFTADSVAEVLPRVQLTAV